MSDLVLNVAVGNYGHTAPLKDGSVKSSMFDMAHTEVSPVTSIFRRMVRELEFDVAEMALSTYLCAAPMGRTLRGFPFFSPGRFTTAASRCMNAPASANREIWKVAGWASAATR